MIWNFLKIAFRFLWRNKTYSILNFLCLTFGLSCSIIAMLHINRMLSFDKFHDNFERLYAVEANVTYFNGDRFPKPVLSASLVDNLEGKIPEFELLTRVANRSYTFINGEKAFTENGLFTDEIFFEMFSFPFVSGSFSEDLWGINSIVISKRMAVKLFGSTDCIGKTLIQKENNNEAGYKIAGVLEDIPSESFFRFDFIIPFSKFIAENSWANETGAAACQIWALLNKEANVDIINRKIRDLIKTQETTLNQELFLFPLKEKTLYNYVGGRRIWGGMQYVIIAGSLGFSILLIACFNFINLAIAMIIRRYREAGIRKVVGAKKSTIILQYVGETFILILLSLLFAAYLVGILLRGFNSMTNGNLHFDFSDFRVILGLTVITVFSVLLSGLLPAIYLSSSNPVNILKGKIVTSHSFSVFRQSLIVFQFTIPIVFIICMMIINVQDKYVRHFDLGFDKDKLLIINNSKNLEDHEESFKTEILSIPGIESVSYSNCIPSRGTTFSNEVGWEGKDPSEKLHFWCINTDFNYNIAVNLNMTKGRYFDKSFPSDSTCYVINNIAAEVMNYENPIGRSLTLEGRKGTIIGVFKDFHTIDLSGPFTPTIITLKPVNRSKILISFSSGNYSSLSDRISSVYKKYEPDIVFQANLFSDLVKTTELTTSSKVIGVAFIIALMLACLGLSGLASFTAESRTKEIGIRKINGATTILVMQLLGKNYTKWLTISIIIALPVAYFVGNIFLSRFNFHAPMPIWTFIAGPLIAYIIALSAVSLQSWSVATRNPVEALRYE
ncbi:MAG: ABC transporter permease [Bacteroidia bacterium]|nr:ABC transporter permease [Bacteroidia bacterium]